MASVGDPQTPNLEFVFFWLIIDGGEEEIGEVRQLDSSKHSGQGHHQEAGRQVLQEESGHSGQSALWAFHVSVICWSK